MKWNDELRDEYAKNILIQLYDAVMRNNAIAGTRVVAEMQPPEEIYPYMDKVDEYVKQNWLLNPVLAKRVKTDYLPNKTYCISVKFKEWESFNRIVLAYDIMAECLMEPVKLSPDAYRDIERILNNEIVARLFADARELFGINDIPNNALYILFREAVQSAKDLLGEDGWSYKVAEQYFYRNIHMMLKFNAEVNYSNK